MYFKPYFGCAPGWSFILTAKFCNVSTGFCINISAMNLQKLTSGKNTLAFEIQSFSTPGNKVRSAVSLHWQYLSSY